MTILELKQLLSAHPEWDNLPFVVDSGDGMNLYPGRTPEVLRKGKFVHHDMLYFINDPGEEIKAFTPI
jgi:hypothetical protein